MKKRLAIVSCLLALVMCLSAFAACAKVKIDDDTLNVLLEALKLDYDDEAKMENFTVPSQIETTDAKGNAIIVYIQWQVGGTTQIYVAKADENARCEVVIPTSRSKTLNFTLKATLVDAEGKAYTDSDKKPFTVTLSLTAPATAADDQGNDDNGNNQDKWCNCDNTVDNGCHCDNTVDKGCHCDNTVDNGCHCDNTGNGGNNSGNGGNQGDNTGDNNQGNGGNNQGNGDDNTGSGNQGGNTDTGKTVTIVIDEQGYAHDTVLTTISKNGLTLTFAQGTNTNNAPRYYEGYNGAQNTLRMYGGNTLTISGKTVTKVVFTFASASDGDNEILVNTGTFSADTWTGSSNNLTFTIDGSKGHRKIVAIEITYQD